LQYGPELRFGGITEDSSIQGSNLEQSSSSFGLLATNRNDPSSSLCSKQLLMQFSFIGSVLMFSQLLSKPIEEGVSRIEDQILDNSAKEGQPI